MGQRYENSSLPDQFSFAKPSSPLPNLWDWQSSKPQAKPAVSIPLSFM